MVGPVLHQTLSNGAVRGDRGAGREERRSPEEEKLKQMNSNFPKVVVNF